jgi:NADH:ubiquinone oxidoreductase subunit H
MTLWDMINSSTVFMTSMFNYKSEYTSLLLSDATFVSLTSLYYKLQYVVDCVNLNLSLVFNSVFFSVSTTTFNALVIAFKFLMLIALLIFIRGGIPRYRFDHLTKIGWIKYLSLVLASILMQFLLLWMC